ncbi:MAG: 3-keto-5-aminohexanoate cleavage protein [Chloroflexi bacterium]|nr:3-keto-5-aminohexanoate cleavage protein [Chloroflexota bacterium]
MAKLSAAEMAKLRKERLERIEHSFNQPAQPKIMTMAPKVYIEAAVPGHAPPEWYERIGIKNLPPISFEDQGDAAADCIKAGAALIHCHPRDPETGIASPHFPPEVRRRHVECIEAVYKRALDKGVDFVTSSHTWTYGHDHITDYIHDSRELLQDGEKDGVGNFYVQMGMIMTGGAYTPDGAHHTEEAIQAGVKFYEANNIKPMLSVELFAMDRIRHYLVDTGALKNKPYWISVQEGKHGSDRIGADFPWANLEIITDAGLLKSFFGTQGKDFVWGTHTGGRNWLQATAQAILCGANFVRSGLEDQFYLYPHRDDTAKKASDTVKLLVELCHALGREVGTAADLRKECNMKLTSKQAVGAGARK